MKANARVRTIPKAVEILREIDPGTAITISAVRRAVREGKISFTPVGTRKLVNVNEIASYFGVSTDEDAWN